MAASAPPPPPPPPPAAAAPPAAAPGSSSPLEDVWTSASGVRLAAAIQSGEVRSLHVLNALLDRIHRLDRHHDADADADADGDADGDGDAEATALNSVVLLYEESARLRAAEADAALDRGEVWGPLHGVPMVIKECNMWANTQMTNGLASAVDGVDSTCGGYNEPFVQRLIDAGAVLFGKTNLPTHAMDWQSFNEVYGQTNNPFDVTKTPGGSSGGAAAAVAACFTPLEVGGDIGGSIRIPASFCGIFGHKPTYGAVDKIGAGSKADLKDVRLAEVMPLKDISVRGPLARTADDLKLLMEVITGMKDMPRPAKKSIGEYKVALISTLDPCPVSNETREAVASLAKKLEAAGADVELDTVKLPFDPDEMFRVYLKLLGCTQGIAETAATGCGALGMDGKTVQRILQENAAKYDASDDCYEAIAARAPFLSHGEWKVANARRHELRVAWRDFFDIYDFLVCPIFTRAAFDHDHKDPMGLGYTIFLESGRTLDVDGEAASYMRSIFWSGLTNSCFLPSTAFPTGLGRDTKLPIGLQIVGPEWSDYLTIEFARLLETELGYAYERPKNRFGDAETC